jgi:hypothetical protein
MRFDRIFRGRTGFVALDRLLAGLHANKAELLMVLDRLEILLHTNGSENDIRCHVARRKISAGTRGETGRDCPDAFLSLGKTCEKLGIAIWDYLASRLKRWRMPRLLNRSTVTSQSDADQPDSPHKNTLLPLSIRSSATPTLAHVGLLRAHTFAPLTFLGGMILAAHPPSADRTLSSFRSWVVVLATDYSLKETYASQPSFDGRRLCALPCLKRIQHAELWFGYHVVGDFDPGRARQPSAEGGLPADRSRMGAARRRVCD